MKLRTGNTICIFIVLFSMLSCNKHVKLEPKLYVNKLRTIQVKDISHYYKYPDGTEMPNDIHGSDVTSMIKVDGKYVQKPFPKSQIEHAKLTFDKPEVCIL